MKKQMKWICMGVLSACFALTASELHPTEGEVADLYVATFHRAPDADGLSYWVNRSGLRLTQIAKSFFDQPESQKVYPPRTTNREFVKRIYRNLFNRDPDEEGLEYWVDELKEGKIDRSLFILAVIHGAQGRDAQLLQEKKAAALRFVQSGENDTEEAQKVISSVEKKFSNAKEKEERDSSAAVSNVETLKFSTPENTLATFDLHWPAGKSYQYRVEGTDRDDFHIGADGRLSFVTPPDFEKQDSYHILVKATAGEESIRKDVFISVKDLPEVPKIGTFWAKIYEHLPVGSKVGTVKILERGDGGKITFRLEGADGRFVIDENGTVRTNVKFDLQRDREYMMKVVAVNKAGESEAKNAIVLVKDRTIKPMFSLHKLHKEIHYDSLGRVVAEELNGRLSIDYRYDEDTNLVGRTVGR